MEFTFSFLPVTVVAAIFLFVLKESVEGYRRFRSEGRAKAAIRKLLAIECELNHATVRSIRRIVMQAQDWSPDDPNASKLSLELSKNGEVIFSEVSHDERSGSKSVLRPTHRDFMSKQLLFVATLDETLYEALQPALDAVNEMEHVRQSLIENIDDPERTHLHSFTHYALEELKTTFEKLNALYIECTGKQLEEFRLR